MSLAILIPLFKPNATQIALNTTQQDMIIVSSARVLLIPKSHSKHSVTSGVARPRLVPIARISATI